LGADNLHRFQNLELRSKIVDGLIPALVLSLLAVVTTLLTEPILELTGKPGLLVFILGMLAIAVYNLEQALVNRYSDVRRTWHGMVAGLLTWIVTGLSGRLGSLDFSNEAGLIILIMVGLIVAVFWRRSILPLGARYFFATFLLNWVIAFVLNAQILFSRWSSVFTLSLRVSGYVSILVGLFLLWWLTVSSKARGQRMRTALLIWFFSSIALYVFWGNLF
jgi:hypothetical protein